MGEPEGSRGPRFGAGTERFLTRHSQSLGVSIRDEKCRARPETLTKSSASRADRAPVFITAPCNLSLYKKARCNSPTVPAVDLPHSSRQAWCGEEEAGLALKEAGLFRPSLPCPHLLWVACLGWHFQGLYLRSTRVSQRTHCSTNVSPPPAVWPQSFGFPAALSPQHLPPSPFPWVAHDENEGAALPSALHP